MIRISATQEARNQTRAGVCNSAFRANTLITTSITVVQIPPAGVGFKKTSNAISLVGTHLKKPPTTDI